MTQLTPVPLNYGHILSLAPRMRQADLLDLTVHGGDPEGALVSGLASGEAYAVLSDGVVIGAGGWTVEGSIWTLWADLTTPQARELLRWAGRWARVLAIRSKRPLSNVFLRGNTLTERWLRLTRCVDIDYANPIHWQGRDYLAFRLKPLEELPYV